jgi:hypothetical protein
MRNAYKLLVGKPNGMRLFGRPRRRWENNIKIDFKLIGSERVGWSYLAQDEIQWRALVDTVMNFMPP